MDHSFGAFGSIRESLARRLAIDSSETYEAKFVDLPYPLVDVKEDGTVAQLTDSSFNAGQYIPIVYFGEPLTSNSRIIISIEDKKAGTKNDAVICKIGLTTCKPSNLKRYLFHTNDVCKGGKLVCKGWSVCLPIYRAETPAIAVILEKIQRGAIARLTTVFTGAVKSCAIKDKTEGSKMSSLSLFPFIILDGLATKVRVRSEAIMQIPASHSASWRSGLPSRVQDDITIDEEAVAKVKLPESWLLGDGVEAYSNHFTRKSTGSHLCVCKLPLSPGQEYIFNISQVDETIRSHTLTLGYTTDDISLIDINSLSVSDSEKWTQFTNILPAVEKDDEIKVKVSECSKFIFISTDKCSPRPVIRNYPASGHLFIEMTPNILVMRLLSATEKEEKKEEKVQTSEETNSSQGNCSVCLSVKANHLLLPCAHLCLCAECFPIHRSSSFEHRCPICRQIVTSHVVVFIP